MRSVRIRRLARLRTILALGALVVSPAMLSPVAIAGAAEGPGPTRYSVAALGSLGGTASAGSSITEGGQIAGFSNMPGDATTHAALWRDGKARDLGTLGGPNSAVLWPANNDGELVVGVSETAQVDQLGEAWSCSAFFPTTTHHICRGFVWQGNRMRPLPTLGGDNGFATGVNHQGQVVGWAENKVHDPTCNAPQVLQFRGVVWDTNRDNHVVELPPLPGDTVSAATAINDAGQVVGISGICANAVGGFSAAHAVIWESGTVTDLGSLGGTAWNTPMAINADGTVVGFANTAGGDPGGFHAHAFIWTKAHGIRDLTPTPQDGASQALGVNEQGQIVGLWCTPSCHAFLWDNGVIRDLNMLRGRGFAGHMTFANDISDEGEITGQAVDPKTGVAVAFRATPIWDLPTGSRAYPARRSSAFSPSQR